MKKLTAKELRELKRLTLNLQNIDEKDFRKVLKRIAGQALST